MTTTKYYVDPQAADGSQYAGDAYDSLEEAIDDARITAAEGWPAVVYVWPAGADGTPDYSGDYLEKFDGAGDVKACTCEDARHGDDGCRWPATTVVGSVFGKWHVCASCATHEQYTLEAPAPAREPHNYTSDEDGPACSCGARFDAGGLSGDYAAHISSIDFPRDPALEAAEDAEWEAWSKMADQVGRHAPKAVAS